MKKPFKIGLFIATILLLTSCAIAQTGFITTIAGTALSNVPYSGDGGQATSATLNYPEATIFDGSGNMYVSDANNNVIRKVIISTGLISTYAGLSYTNTQLFGGITPNGGISGDGGPATKAKLHAPRGLAFDANNNLYIADVANNRIRMVNSLGIITVFAGGNGGYGNVYGYSGDGGPATNARLFNPQGVAVDANGNVFISDTRNYVIRKVATTGVITTIAGTGGTAGYTGDGGAAVSATLNYPAGIAVDANNNLFVADKTNNVIRKVATTGTITTFAGTGTLGYSGDAGQATAATLDYPIGVNFDASGNLYIADQGNMVIRKVIVSTGVISTYAGTGTGKGTLNGTYTGDGAAATAAGLNLPSGISFSAGHGFISDAKNNVIRRVQ
jgi:sugar lactone lactonase YvrE